jgi:hypothetical protein
MPSATPLSADAAAVHYAACTLADGNTPYIGWPRYVPLLALRKAAELPAAAFDAAIRELAEGFHAFLRVNDVSTAADDEASVMHNGTDYHLITTDPWGDRRDELALGGTAGGGA